jgi:hypothetical protein
VQRHRAVSLPQIGTLKTASFGLRKRGSERPEWDRHSDRIHPPATSHEDVP